MMVNGEFTSIWPDLQIVVDPGNLVPRKFWSCKKVLSKIHALFAENYVFVGNDKLILVVEHVAWNLVWGRRKQNKVYIQQEILLIFFRNQSKFIIRDKCVSFDKKCMNFAQNFLATPKLFWNLVPRFHHYLQVW